MPGNVTDRMAHWQDVQNTIAGYPVRRIWEIYNKMLVDRQKFILGNDWFGWGGGGFLARYGNSGALVLRYHDFVEQLTFMLDYRCGVYPIYPAESNLPLLNSFSTILQYGSRKYPELHKSLDWGYSVYPHISEYKPEEFYKTAAAGGDDQYAFINQYQLFEKLWNLLHYYGGVCISQRRDGLQYWEDGNGQRHSDTTFTPYHGKLRFFYTPTDNLEYKYVCNAAMNDSGDRSSTGIVQYGSGRNILYESNWMRGTFTSPWFQQTGGGDEGLIAFGAHLFIYPHFPDFYDPDTLEPMYF